MKKNLITLLTDFGTADHYVSAMKGVMAGICPEAQFVDITHQVGAFGIEEAAWTLAQAAPCFPPGTVHLVVVDPGVGSSRRALVAESGGQVFVGPDNGVLTLVLEADPGSEVHEVTAEKYFRQPVSRTFHGRDIFAPVAANVAAGVLPEAFGHPVGEWKRLAWMRPECNPDGIWTGKVIKIDRFGNLITNLSAEIPQPWRIEIASVAVTRVVNSYSEAVDSELFAIAGSAGTIEICLNQASAAQAIGAVTSTAVQLTGGKR